MYVTPEDHLYIEDHERREEGGTPAIIESIRAGLVFKLQQEVGTDEIERREQSFVERAIKRFNAVSNIEILGGDTAPRLSIMSLRFRHGHRDLHYGFVVSLLNDLFGIQVRGGCSCAGPYGHSLLGMDMNYSRDIETEIQNGAIVLRPGWVRLNFNYFIGEQEFEFLLRAIELVAEHGWRLLPYYQFNDKSGVWQFQGQAMGLVSSLEDWRFAEFVYSKTASIDTLPTLQDICDQAKAELTRVDRQENKYELQLTEAGERLRWFLLPQEAAGDLCKTIARAS